MEVALTALLAPVAGGRRYWVRAPQNMKVKPYLLLSCISSLPSYHYLGASGCVAARVQIDVYADTATSAHDTAQQLKTLLSGYRGGTIMAIFLDGERELPASDAGDVNALFRISIDIMIHYQEN